ncbi:MAG: sugar phosphate isomerase/epimerase family protein [Planctomycetota bacterium]|jgi:sugar phosphate isomerase/epimerase
MDFSYAGSPPSLAPTLANLGERPRETLDRLAAEGYGHVQLSAAQPGLRPRELDRSARRDLLATLRRRELVPSGLDLWIPLAHWQDPSTVNRALDAVAAALRLAADLGRLVLSLGLPPAPGEGRDTLREEVADEATRQGVTIADHAVPPVDHPVLAAGLDPAAWIALGRDPVEAVGELGPRLISARLCDLLPEGQRAPIGTESGGLEVGAYREAVMCAGLDEPLIVDLRGWSDPWAGLAQTVEAWQRNHP